MKHLLLALLFTSFTVNTDFINKDNFDSKISHGVSVVEFWAGWNESNQFGDLERLKECNTYRVDIGSEFELQVDNEILVVPTIVVFNNGVETNRFEANIMFQLEVSKKDVQAKVDSIILSKFQ